MNIKTNTLRDEANQLADAALGILSATVEVAEETGEEVRHQFDAVVDRGRHAYDRAYETAVDGARTADGIVHEQPYKVLAVALGLGALLGFLLARR